VPSEGLAGRDRADLARQRRKPAGEGRPEVQRSSQWPASSESSAQKPGWGGRKPNRRFAARRPRR
jgi:hypothetical protein